MWLYKKETLCTSQLITALCIETNNEFAEYTICTQVNRIRIQLTCDKAMKRKHIVDSKKEQQNVKSWNDTKMKMLAIKKHFRKWCYLLACAAIYKKTKKNKTCASIHNV